MNKAVAIFDVSPEFMTDHMPMFARMLAGFVVLSARRYGIADAVMIEYQCWHPDIPEVVEGADLPRGHWQLTMMPDRLTWFFEVNGTHYAQGFMFIDGSGAVQAQ